MISISFCIVFILFSSILIFFWYLNSFSVSIFLIYMLCSFENSNNSSLHCVHFAWIYEWRKLNMFSILNAHIPLALVHVLVSCHLMYILELHRIFLVFLMTIFYVKLLNVYFTCVEELQGGNQTCQDVQELSHFVAVTLQYCVVRGSSHLFFFFLSFPISTQSVLGLSDFLVICKFNCVHLMAISFKKNQLRYCQSFNNFHCYLHKS